MSRKVKTLYEEISPLYPLTTHRLLDEKVDRYLTEEKSLNNRKLVSIQYLIHGNVLYAKIITED